MSSSDDCPFVGLDPFTQRHARYFFGRALDSQVIADNVLTRPITVLYGRSGVGKSSVLNVGLPAALAGGRVKPSLVTCGCWQQASTLVAWLHKVVEAARPTPKRPLVVVLDQFEEYFLYRSAPAGDAFEQAMAALLERRDLRAHLLFSLRDDGLHLLDALRLRLPGVLDNTLELKHLDEGAAREAIAGPIAVYNKGKSAARTVHVKDGFVDDLLSSLRSSLVATGQRQSTAPEEIAIELPFLQLTLQQLWRKMPERGKRLLSGDLLTEMGGIDGIVEAHVRGKLDAFSLGERQLACDVFHYLVTPSGGKFAHLPQDLASLASETAGRRIDSGDVGWLLRQLADGDARVLRQTGERFELFHDALARPVLNWRADYLEKAPFGVLTEAVTGRVFHLFGGGYLFGRSTDYKRQTPLSFVPVSRNQFLILKNGQILDLRSAYGTTVNAKPLHLGETEVILTSGDIIGLANTAAVIFQTINDAPPEAMTEGGCIADRGLGEGWGLLIDGGTRRITGLTDATAYLAFDGKGALITATKRPTGAFAAIHRNDAAEVRITALSDQPPLVVIERKDSYHDRERALVPDEEFVVGLRGIGDPLAQSVSDMEGAERGVFGFGERHFEIIVFKDYVVG